MSHLSALTLSFFFINPRCLILSYNLIVLMSHLWILTSSFVKPQINVASLSIIAFCFSLLRLDVPSLSINIFFFFSQVGCLIL